MTTCIGPTPLREDDLFAVLDDEATTDIHTHLAECAFCQARFDQLRAFDEGLLGALAWGSAQTEAFQASIAPYFREHPAPVVDPSPSLWERAAAVVRQLTVVPWETVGSLRTVAIPEQEQVERTVAQIAGITLLLESYPTSQVGTIRLKGMVLDLQDNDVSDDAPLRWARALAEVRQGNQVKKVALLDEGAEFGIAQMEVGAWDVYITAEWGEVLALTNIRLE